MSNYKQDCRKAESCCSLAGMRANETRQPLHMRRGLLVWSASVRGYGTKKIIWEHAGNKGTFGNAAYVTLT